MKIQIDVITGFLDSGKSNYINELIKEDRYLKEKTVIIQCENGQTEINKNDNLYVVKCNNENIINEEFFLDIIKEYSPSRIIIEHNGTWSIQLLLDLLDSSRLRKSCLLDKIVHIVDVNTFEVFINNMGSMLLEQISLSNTIILNKTDNFPFEKLEGIRKTLKTLNKSAKVYKCITKRESNDNKIIYESLIGINNFPRNRGDKLFLAFALFIFGYIVFALFRGGAFSFSDIDLSRYQTFSTLFISILMQAFPFIIIGVFISAIFQVLVPEEAILKVFPKNPVAAFIVSITAGIFFPICDCAIVPIAGKLVKKGVPVHCAITFLLAAPIVDPVVIASTIYAFPGNPKIAIYRVVIGLTVAISVGIITLIFGQKDNVLLNNINNSWCGCEACTIKNLKNKSIINKIYLVFNHAGSEFLMVGRFLIIGAFLSVLAQTSLPQDIMARISSQGLISIFVMMGAAFFLSICSTSDAFIARSFTNHFPMSSVMGFMVMGAMIDIKNVFLLLGTFKRRFVIELLFTIIALAFSIITIYTLLLF